MGSMWRLSEGGGGDRKGGREEGRNGRMGREGRRKGEREGRMEEERGEKRDIAWELGIRVMHWQAFLAVKHEEVGI